jgi:hypothetical protein
MGFSATGDERETNTSIKVTLPNSHDTQTRNSGPGHQPHTRPQAESITDSVHTTLTLLLNDSPCHPLNIPGYSSHPHPHPPFCPHAWLDFRSSRTPPATPAAASRAERAADPRPRAAAAAITSNSFKLPPTLALSKGAAAVQGRVPKGPVDSLRAPTAVTKTSPAVGGRLAAGGRVVLGGISTGKPRDVRTIASNSPCSADCRSD